MKRINISLFRRLEANYIKNILIICCITIAIVCSISNQFVVSLMDNLSNIEYLDTPSNIVYVDCEDCEKKYNDLGFIKEDFGNVSYNYFSKENIGYVKLSEASLNIELIGVSEFDSKETIPSFDTFGATEYIELLAGSCFSKDDIIKKSNCVLIYKSIGEYIFGSDSSIIGEKVEIDSKIYEVIGILKDTPDIIRLMKKIEYNKKGYFKIPLISYFKSDSKVSTILLDFGAELGENGLEKVKKALDSNGFLGASVTNKSFEISNRISNEDDTYNILKIVLNFVIVAMCLLSILIIYLALRDRKYEIVLRRAFGANTIQIMNLLLVEILLIFFISAVIAFGISTIIIAIIDIWIKNTYYIFAYSIGFNTFITPILIIFISVMLMSSLLIYIFTKNKISDGLRRLD